MIGANAALASRLDAALAQAVEDGVTPGAVCEVTVAGHSTVTATAGHLESHDRTGAPIPFERRSPVTAATVYDLASVSKVFTSITLLSLADEGTVDLDIGVGEWLPTFREGARSRVTLAHLLSHTGGLPPVHPHTIRHAVGGFGTDHPHWVAPNRTAFLDSVLSLALERPPGVDKVYSCLGYIASMAVAEAATGMSWAQLVRERVLAPLGLGRTTFTPDASRTAPTEFQPELGRGMVRGVVHDETARALGGAAGNAGLFAPAADLSALGSALLTGLPGVLRPESASLLWEDQLPELLGANATAVENRLGYGQSLGVRIGQSSWMGEAGTQARGHTGFVGTSLLVDRERDLVVTLLTNRVHPNRSLSDATALRHAISTIAYAC